MAVKRGRGRPPKQFTREEVSLIRRAWKETRTVEGCRMAHQRLSGRERPVSWDTMRRWLDLIGTRLDPTKG